MLSLVAGLVAAAPALAQEEGESKVKAGLERSGFYVGGNVGISALDGGFEMAALSLRGGVRGGRLAGDLEIFYQVESAKNEGRVATAISGFLNGRAYLVHKTRVQPYLLGGVGVQSLYLESPGPQRDQNELAVALRGGAGLELILLDRLSLDANVFYTRGFGNLNSDSVTATAGAVFYF